MAIKQGDVVTLKSGGPKMTIQAEVKRDLWQCSWFDEGELREGMFVTESLQPVDADEE